MPVRLPSPVSLGVVLAVVVAFLGPRPARPLPTRPGQPSSEAVPPAPPRGTLPPLPPARVLPAVPPAAASVSDPRRQRGMSLGLFAEDISFDYGPLLKEIAALGATHVQLVVP